MSEDRPETLRRGWTTGACAAGAARAAFQALVSGAFPDPVPVALPKGVRPSFALAHCSLEGANAQAAIVKDAGDDPDVTHGALIVAEVRLGARGSGLKYFAGEGVGTVTRAGLPLPPGEPAINPMPRAIIAENIGEVAHAFGVGADAEITIGVPGGEKLAERTLNRRLGIVGGLSILGTTGIVVPYSCAAWIDSIHRGVDVARAGGLDLVVGSTGSTSEAAAQALYGLPETAMIEMGDFVGGLLKYLKSHPVPRVAIAGGFAKMAKLADGRLDLHSKRGEVDLGALARLALAHGASDALAAEIGQANSALEAVEASLRQGFPLAALVAGAARDVASGALPNGVEIETLVFARDGALLARSGFAPVHAPPR